MANAMWRMGACADRARRGFTLIELLVVISIIALLIGILLPALGAARKTAQSAVCLGNLRSVGQATAIYATDSKDYLAGPRTSGANDIRLDKSTSPVSRQDWYSPMLGDSLGLPDDPVDRIRAIFNDEFHCPTNNEFATGTLGYPNNLETRHSSYSMAVGFHQYDSAGNSIVPNVVLPTGYGPRIDRVGPPSAKSLAFDGARYLTITGTDVKFTFDWAPNVNKGGSFMSIGPTRPYIEGSEGGDPFRYIDQDGTPDDISKRTAYRHSENLNMVFYDGHAKSMSGYEAAKGDADGTAIFMYFPTSSVFGGSVVFD